MPGDDLAERLDAVERALTDDDTDLTDVRTAATLSEDVRRLEGRIAELETTVEELEAAVEAVRGYAGNLRAVNRDVERRASAALAKAEALEASVGPVNPDEARGPGASEYQAQRTTPPEAETDGRRQPTTDRDPRIDTDDDPGRGAGAPDGQSGRTDTRPAGRSNGADQSGTEQFIERVRDAL